MNEKRRELGHTCFGNMDGNFVFVVLVVVLAVMTTREAHDVDGVKELEKKGIAGQKRCHDST